MTPDDPQSCLQHKAVNAYGYLEEGHFLVPKAIATSPPRLRHNGYPTSSGLQVANELEGRRAR